MDLVAKTVQRCMGADEVAALSASVAWEDEVHFNSPLSVFQPSRFAVLDVVSVGTPLIRSWVIFWPRSVDSNFFDRCVHDLTPSAFRLFLPFDYPDYTTFLATEQYNWCNRKNRIWRKPRRMYVQTRGVGDRSAVR